MNRLSKALASSALVASLALTGAANANDFSNTNIVDIVIEVSGDSGFDGNSSDYDILREALIATGLADAVAASNDITVFAPIDHAFIALARDLGFPGRDEAGAFAFIAQFTGFKSAAEPGLLDDVLLYHVAPTARTVFQLRRAGNIPTLLGSDNTVRVVFSRVKDNDKTDRDPRIRAPRNLVAQNGIIQTINGVLRPVDLEPAPAETVVSWLVGKSGGSGFDRNFRDYDILLAAAEAAGLVGTLQTAADITLFAPTDISFILLARELGYKGWKEEGAFAKIAEATNYVSTSDPGLLDDVLKYHVAPGGRTVSALNQDSPIPTLFGESLVVNGPKVRDADTDDRDPVITLPRNVDAGNGVVQTLFRVLRPIDLP